MTEPSSKTPPSTNIKVHNAMLLFEVHPNWKDRKTLPPVAKQGRLIFQLIRKHGPIHKLSLMSLLQENLPGVEDHDKPRYLGYVMKRYQRILAEGGYITITRTTKNKYGTRKTQNPEVHEPGDRLHTADAVSPTHGEVDSAGLQSP